VFDTQVAWALTSAEYSVSLAYLKFKLLGMRTGKPHQADDWKRRPLPKSQLAYAAADIEDLPEMHRLLRERLAEKNRGELVYEASAEATRPVRSEIEGISLDSFRNAWQLDREGQAALRHIVTWYNALDVRERENAPEMKTLLAIAARLPRTRDDLGRIKGVSRWFANERGHRFVEDLVTATASADDASFVPIDPPPYATFEEIRVDGWLARLRAEICIELEVAPELAFPGRVLKKMRQLVLETGDLRLAVGALDGWRKQLLGDRLAQLGAKLAGTEPSSPRS
jgi:ribonuclease D